ncbi:MAG: hypothetical protein JSW67_06860 [Candidatus Latescibacterota bacterium]|nr:MAG: hypothetical protein JSW67_06860 [Candidatus Latescibacterota bacterium]
MGKIFGSRPGVVCACLLLVGCGAPSDETGEAVPDSAVARLDENHLLGEPIVAENLTVWPVFAEQPLEIGEFLTLNDAQTADLAVVRELGDATPSGATPTSIRHQRARVGKLEIENKGDLPILVCAGTVVKGGNQDRQIAQDFVVPPQSRVPVDAFCVERGRWSGRRHGERTKGLFLASRSMAPKSVRAMAQYEKNQGKVWEEVDAYVSQRASEAAGTSLLLSIDAADATARKVDQRLAQEVRAHFVTARENGSAPVGFAYAIDGKPVTVRTFAHSRIFENHFDIFLASMCMEADIAQRMASRRQERKGQFEEASAEDVVALVRALESYREELQATAAANLNGYRKGDLGFNSNCYLEQGNKQIALTQDWTAR